MAARQDASHVGIGVDKLPNQNENLRTRLHTCSQELLTFVQFVCLNASISAAPCIIWQSVLRCGTIGGRAMHQIVPSVAVQARATLATTPCANTNNINNGNANRVAAISRVESNDFDPRAEAIIEIIKLDVHATYFLF